MTHSSHSIPFELCVSTAFSTEKLSATLPLSGTWPDKGTEGLLLAGTPVLREDTGCDRRDSRVWPRLKHASFLETNHNCQSRQRISNMISRSAPNPGSKGSRTVFRACQETAEQIHTQTYQQRVPCSAIQYSDTVGGLLPKPRSLCRGRRRRET